MTDQNTIETDDEWIIRSFTKRSFAQLTKCGCDFCLQAIEAKNRTICPRSAADRHIDMNMNAVGETAMHADLPRGPNDGTFLLQESRAERIERVMYALTESVPTTKGMGPKDRANRLHAELERRIELAKRALRPEAEADR